MSKTFKGENILLRWGQRLSKTFKGENILLWPGDKVMSKTLNSKFLFEFERAK